MGVFCIPAAYVPGARCKARLESKMYGLSPIFNYDLLPQANGGAATDRATAAATSCELYGDTATAAGAKDCAACDMGPKTCPGMAGGPDGLARRMTKMTVSALLQGVGTPLASPPPWATDTDEDVFEKLARLDNVGYFNGV